MIIIYNICDTEVKAISSCFRDITYYDLLVNCNLSKENKFPTIGDLVLCKVLNIGNYNVIENINSEEIEIYTGDYIIGVLGDRFSGTNLYGIVPKHPIAIGEQLDLLAIGGIVGECQGKESAKTSKIEVLGFLCYNNEIVNTKKLTKPLTIEQSEIKCKILSVCGTSADVGKTTLATKIIKNLKNKNYSVAAIKVFGTGRMRDKFKFSSSGADLALDFVDFGYPTTYGLGENEYIDLLKMMIHSVSLYDYVVVEIGGDILNHITKIIVDYFDKMGSKNFLVVNDAMGAITGIGLMKNNTGIFSWKQNIYSLKQKINYNNTFSFDDDDINTYIMA